MTQELLFAMIEKAGMIPLPVTREGEDKELLHYYDGTLVKFLAAAKSIGSTAILSTAYPLLEDQFFYGFDDDKEFEGEVGEVDLVQILPALVPYRRRVGEIYGFFLQARGGAADICYFLEQTWYAEFEREVERAEGMAILLRRKKKKH
jgi:hypothetical protein